jgi:hypothetical protein
MTFPISHADWAGEFPQKVSLPSEGACFAGHPNIAKVLDAGGSARGGFHGHGWALIWFNKKGFQFGL